MYTLAATLDKDEYSNYMDKECALGKYTVIVQSYRNESQSGSYARGLKWTHTTYGYLIRRLKGTKYYRPTRYSPDHGATWYASFAEMKKQRAGKIKLDVNKTKEFAYAAIQQLNKQYGY